MRWISIEKLYFSKNVFKNKKTNNVWNNTKLQVNIQLYRKRDTTDKNIGLALKVERKVRKKIWIKNTKIYGAIISERPEYI